MANEYYLYADEVSAAVLDDVAQKILLVGSDFGYGNFGDIVQHKNSIRLHKELGKFQTVSILATNAISDTNFPRFAKLAYGTDAAIFVSEFPIDLTKSSLSLKPVHLIRNVSALHLYGGGFLNDKWGEFVLGVTEYLLHTLSIQTYVVSGQQITKPYEDRVTRHIDVYRPILFGVRDVLSREWLEGTGYKAEFSFDDATEMLQGLTSVSPVKRGIGLLLHLNVSDYTNNGPENSGFPEELQTLAIDDRTISRVTVLQAYADRRGEVIDSREAIKALERAFPFFDYRVVELPTLAYQTGMLLKAAIQGEIGYSCSYHVALWLQLAGIPCWLRGSNSFYEQKASALQIHQELSSFLKNPILADHSSNLERRALWQERLRMAILSASEISTVYEFRPPSSITPLPLRFKGKPLQVPATHKEHDLSSGQEEVQQQLGQIMQSNVVNSEFETSLHALRQQFDGDIQQLREQIFARDAQITELGAIAHEFRQRAEAAEAPIAGPSPIKRLLVRIWERLPKRYQTAIEPLADFIDRKVK